MLNFNHMAPPPPSPTEGGVGKMDPLDPEGGGGVAEKGKFASEIPPQEAAEMEAWFEKLEEKLQRVPKEEIERGAQKIKDFLDGKIGWADVFHFTPEQTFQIAEMGYNHFKLGRYQDAERFFKVLTILDWDNYYYHSMLGSILQRQKREGEAIVEYSQALESNPHDIVSLTNRGEIFMKHGWMKDAQRDFEKAVELDPKGENPWANRSKNLLGEIKKGKRK